MTGNLTPTKRRRSSPQLSTGGDGLPVEEAPLWLLAILVVMFWLPIFPALVGLLAGWGWWRGDWRTTAAAALAIAILAVVGLATRPSWRRQREPMAADNRPFFVRAWSWAMTALVLPNVLFGVIVLTHSGTPLSYEGLLALGLLLSGIQAGLAWLDRRKRGAQ
jgi:hypothetical protein